MLNQSAPNDAQSSDHLGGDITVINERLHYGYIAIAALVLALYVCTVGFYFTFTETVLPGSDPFTYTNGFFMLLDLARDDYLGTLKMVLTGWNWYWLLNIPIVLLSPILVKEPFSLSVVNFIMYGLATASVFRLARYLNLSNGFSFALALILWIYPVNYGFLTHLSVPVMALDAAFSAILYVAIAHTLIYAMDPGKIKNALIAGVSTGIAVWGRGNSLPVVGLVIFCPTVVAAYAVWKQKSRPLLINFMIFGVIAASLAAYFYIINWTPITTYYTGHATRAIRHAWSLNDALPFLKNIPGFFFWLALNSIPTISMTWISHLVVFLGLYIAFKRNNRLGGSPANALKLLAGTGAFIYFGTYVINTILFIDPVWTVENTLFLYDPMRIGLTLCIFVVLASFIIARQIRFQQWVVIPLAVATLFYGVFFTALHIPQARSDRPSPREVESFALGLDELLKGGTLSFLWYENYNRPLIQYYRLKNNLPLIKMYRYKYTDSDLFSWYDYTEEKHRRVREEIKKHFEEATLIIIPEYSDLFSPQEPYALYKFKDEIGDYLNSPESPRFVIRMILHDTPTTRLLVLQREDKAGGMGEPLKLPYGPSGSTPGPD